MLKVLVLAAVATVTGGAAGAAVIEATWTGTVFSGYDETDFWGTGSTDLAGLSYTMTFTYDTALGARSTVPGVSDYVFGGGAYFGSPATPILSASLKINGVTGSSAGSHSGQALTNDAAGGINYFTTYASDSVLLPNGTATDALMYGYFSDYGQAAGLFTPGSLDAPFAVSGLGGQDCSAMFCGAFLFSLLDPFAVQYTYYTQGFLSVDSLTVRDITVAPIPLPASALMLLAAVGGMIGVRKRRKCDSGEAAGS
jgi:hypothetical protein